MTIKEAKKFNGWFILNLSQERRILEKNWVSMALLERRIRQIAEQMFMPCMSVYSAGILLEDIWSLSEYSEGGFSTQESLDEGFHHCFIYW